MDDSLDLVLDSDNPLEVSKHLGEIADHMSEWEGPIAECLGLTVPEIACVKTKHPGKLPLQTREALEKWKQKEGEDATYRNLIRVFSEAGYHQYATFVKNICTSSIQVRKQRPSIPDFVRDYIEQLKKLYISGTRFMQPDWPPIKAREPTNLVIVSELGVEEGFSREKIETLKNDYVHGKIDNITAYKKEIELADILNPVPSDDGKSTNKPKVLMDGAPGVGKTTLAIKACSDWAKNRLFGRYELLVFVSLREIKHKKGETLGDLFPCCSDKRVVDYYERNGGKHVVMIFDGYDELSFQQRRVNSIFLDVIRGEVLPDCAVLVTSRPYASNYLHQLESINRHVEILGFKKEQIYACVEKSLSDSDNAKTLIHQLEEREDILSLCYIPLNCMIMIHVYEQKKTLTTTMTELMRQFIIDTVTRGIKYIQLSPEVENVCIKDLDNLPHPADEQLSALEKLAYQNLIKDQFIFSQDELLTVFSGLKSFSESCDVTKLCLSLLTSLHTVSGNTDRHFQFLHLTIQEYLAARHAVKISNNGEQIIILQKFMDEPRFRLFLLFYVGMMPLDRDITRYFFHTRLQGSKDSDSAVYHHKADPVIEKFLYFAHMIFESQQFDTFVDLFDMLNNKKILSLKNCKLTLFDCTVLSHFFCSIDHSWDELNLQNCSLGMHSLQIFDRVYKNRNSGKKTNFESINFNGNDPEMLYHLNIFPWLSNVKKLTFEDQTHRVSKPLNLHIIAHIPQINIRVVFSSSNDVYMLPAFSYCICKTDTDEVELCRTELGEAFVTHLRGIEVLSLTKVDCTVLHMLHPFIQSLKVLVLHGIDDIDGWLFHYASVLAQSRALQQLKIWDVGITSSSAKILFQALSKNTSMYDLYLSMNSEFLHQVEDFGEEIKMFLSMNNTITSLCMSNCINDQIIKYLIAGLKLNSTLVKLDVRGNPLSVNAIEKLISVTVNHRGLDQLSIENNVFRKQNIMEWTLESTNKVTEKLFCALSNLKILHNCYHHVVDLSLSSSDLDTFVCIKLFQVLQQNRHVKQLTFKDKFSFSTNDKSVSLAIQKMFTTNNTLQSLYYQSSKNQQDCVCEEIASGISKSVSLREASLTMHSFSGFSRIMRGLRNCGLKVLEMKLHYDSRSQLTQRDSELIGLEFEQFLSNNTTLVELKLGFVLDDSLVSRIAEGLLRNKSLKNLSVRLGPGVSSGAAKLFRSTNGTLTSIVIETVGSLTKEDDYWSLVLYENGIAMWSQLQYYAMQAGVPNYKVTLSREARMNFPYSYQVHKVFSVLALSKNLSMIDFSNLVMLDNDKFGAKKIGLALKDMLSTSSSLEILIFNSSKLPVGVWEYAAEGLSTNNSLKTLDLCHCGISPNEAASIFTFLKSNHKLEKLDISENSDIIKQDDHPKVNKAIEAMFRFNSSVIDMNLKNSVNDKAIIKAVNGLKRNQSSNLKKLALDERCFTVSTLQYVLLMVKDCVGLTLEFSEVTFAFSAEPDNIWLNFIDMIYHKDRLRIILSFNRKTCKSEKLFCSICNICLQDQVVVNIVELELNNIDDDETVITMFKLLSQETLSRLKHITLKGKFHYTISGDAAGQGLKSMLASNETLYELKLPKIDEAVATGLMSGLLENNTLGSVYFVFETLSDHLVAKLLAVLDSSNSGLLKVEISGLPPIHRPTRWSMWSMALDESVPYCHVSIKLFPKFICKICEASVHPDSRIANAILASFSKLELSLSDLDVTLLIDLFKLLATNRTFKTLMLSAKAKLLKDEKVNLSTAIEDMLVSNTTLKELNLSHVLDDEVAYGIVAGLKRNQTLRSLQIDTNILNLRFIAAIMKNFSQEESGITILSINNLFVLEKCENLSLSQWKIKIFNENIWSSFLNVLKTIAPGVKLVAALDSLDCGGCINVCNSPKFDISCKTLNVQLIKEEMCTTEGIMQQKNRKDGINARLLLANLTTLEVLALKGCFISDEACCNIIHSARYLKKLELSHNSISKESALRLIQELITQTESEEVILEELDVSNNNLDQSSHDLGHAFRSLLESCKLKVLKCASCLINDNICECIASGIKSNHDLICLDLRYNNITTIGAETLMVCLQQNSCLKELDLSGNALFTNNDGISSHTRFSQAVSKMLECNHSLVNFNLDCVNLDIATLSEISKGLKNNSALKILSVNISKCSVNDISSLIPTLSTKLTCFNFSDICSLCSSDIGWTVEVKRNSSLSQIFTTLCLSEVNITKVVISKAPELELNFFECNLSCPQLQSLFGSLEDNYVLKKLSLSLLSSNLTHTECQDLRHSIKFMLKKNCTLTHLELLGTISDEIFQGLEEGIKANGSIRVLRVQVNILQCGTIVDFVKSMEISNILSVSLHPLIELFRPFTSSLWQVKAYCPSVMLLEFICNLDQGNVKHSLLSELTSLNFSEMSELDDTLTSSLIQALKDSTVTCFNIPNFWTIGERAQNTLEQLISCNKYLQHLTFDSVTDSVVLAIAKGLRDNKSLQTLEINITPLSENALSQLLQSFSNHPLKLIPQGQYISFVRCDSELQNQKADIRTVLSSLATQSPNLERVLQCLYDLKDLTIALPQQTSSLFLMSQTTLGNKVMGNSLKDGLKSCKSLRVLRLQCAVSADFLQGLIAGLKENVTLHSLEINTKSLSMNDISPLFSVLNCSHLTKVELVEQYLLLKVSGRNYWKIEQLNYYDERSFRKLFLIHNYIEIDSLICRFVGTVALKLSSENISLILIILKSIECGTFPVKYLHLVFDNKEGDESKTTGRAIEKMLKVSKSLETLTVVHLRDNIFEEHIVSGLSQTCSLLCVIINEKLLSAERNSLLKKIINADFTNSSVCVIQFDNISLHNGIKKDPDWKIQNDSRLKPKAIPNWKVDSDDKSGIVRTFFLLNQTLLDKESCSHSDSTLIIGKSVLQNLRILDLSHICLNFVALFEILQNDTRVIDLNLSDCTQAVSVDIFQRNEKLKSMLTCNTSLKVLNLTGLMDETFASSLIEVLPLCSLKSLSLDLNIKAYAFDKVEGLVCSYINSKLIQLTFTDICHLQKELDTQCIPQCISLECSLTLPFSVSLLNSWSTLFMLISINKQFSRLNLTLGTMDHLTLNVYRMFFTSVIQHCQLDSPSAPMNLLQSLKVLQLGITHDTSDLAMAIIESLPHCHMSCLEDLRLSHDKSIFMFISKCRALASCYEQLLSSSETLLSVNFGHINDVIAQGVAAGLKSSKSKTLQFNASSLTTKSIASLFHFIINGNLTCMQISDGLFIKKMEEGSMRNYSVDVFGDNIFLCKIFIALAQASPYHCSTLMTSFASGNKLDLRVQDVHSAQPQSIKSALVSDVIKNIMLKGGSYITELILSSNTELTKNDEDLVGSALEQLLISDGCTLHSLRLDACQIPDTVCMKISEGLAENASLKTLDLSRNLLTSYGIGKLLASLATNDTLMELDLSDNELTDSQAISDEIGNEIEYVVKENSTLAVLHLTSDSKNCLPPSIVSKIATGLCDNTALRVLSLRIVEEEVLVKLFESLQQNQVLNELNIEESSVTNALVGLSVQNMLKYNKALEILKIGYSGITDEVCKLIAGGLRNNNQLKTLNLCNNRICSSGMISLFQVLDDNKCCLKELNISLNCDRPWRASDDIQLDRILATNSSLEVLIISDGGYFGEWFGLELFKGLKHNSKLHTLDISRNYFDATTSKVFTEMIKRHTTLIQLDISYCQFTFWNLNFTNTSLKKVTISSDLRSLFDTETSEMEIDVIDPHMHN